MIQKETRLKMKTKSCEAWANACIYAYISGFERKSILLDCQPLGCSLCWDLLEMSFRVIRYSTVFLNTGIALRSFVVYKLKKNMAMVISGRVIRWLHKFLMGEILITMNHSA